MGTLIISVLLAMVCLLLFIVVKQDGSKPPIDGDNVEQSRKMPSIIGQVKTTLQPQLPKDDKIPKILKEKVLESANALPDWEEEEEEMVGSAIFNNETGFATGVTFDELANLGRLLERPMLMPAEKEVAAGMISKIDGTELLNLLESNLGDASKKIAMLLDIRLTEG